MKLILLTKIIDNKKIMILKDVEGVLRYDQLPYIRCNHWFYIEYGGSLGTKHLKGRTFNINIGRGYITEEDIEYLKLGMKELHEIKNKLKADGYIEEIIEIK